MNPFQAQYPLGPKKFWKKITVSMLGFGILPPILLLLLVCFPLVLSGDRAAGAFVGFFGLLAFGWFVLVCICMIFYSLYVRAYIRTYYYNADNDFVTIRKGVFAPQEIHVQYAKIQDVYVDQDIIDRIMGLYDVHIASATAASSMEAHIDGVDSATAEGLKHFLLDKLRGGNGNTAVAQMTDAQAPSSNSPTIAPAVFTEEISNKTYPFESVFITYSIIARLLMGLFVSGLISLDVSAKIFDMSSFLLLWLGMFIVIFVIYLIGFNLWKGNYKFQFLPEYIFQRTGVISISETHVPYRTVQDVRISQSILERIFGLATVAIENATANNLQGKNNSIKLPGNTLENANKIAEALKKVVFSSNANKVGV